MADITDDFGRTKEMDNAGFEKLASMLKSAVKTTTDFISKSKEEVGSNKGLSKMEKALENLGEDIKKNTSSAKKFVEEVTKAVEKLGKVKKTKKETSSFEDFKKIQSEQSKILSMILKNQQKAKSEKLALYTSGSSSLPKTKSLSDIGFKARGPDRYPAMLSKNEFVINEKAAKKHGPLLNRINQGDSFRGYRLGGKVKYLDKGTKTGALGPANTPSRIHGSSNFSINVDMNNVKEIGEKAEDIGKQMADSVQKGFRQNYKLKLARFFTGGGALLLGGQADFLQTLFGGAVRDATDFQREMKNIAFQTQGITGDFRGLQKEFSKLGDSIAKRTGKNLDAIQESYLRNLQKGFKSNKAGLKVIESGLKLSTMIGSETHQTADLFADWYRRLKLSSNEMNKMSRDMRSVALSTGVTGDELISVMKSSEGILKNLKNQGNLTTGAAKNIVSMMAESTKFGFEESAGRVLDALSGTNKILDADDKTKALLFTIGNRMGGGATSSMIRGTFSKDRNNLAGFSDQLLQLTSSLSNGAIQGLEDFDKLSEKEKELLTIRLKGFGLEIAEAKNLIETTKKASKGLSGNLEDLDKKINSEYSTGAEKKLAKQQKTELLKNSGLDLLSAFRDKSSDEGLSKVMSDVINNSDYKNSIEDLAAASKALGYGDISSMSPEKQAQTAALVASKQLSALAKENGMSIKDYSSEFEKAIAKGDSKKFNEIYDEFSKKSDELGIKMATNVSPQEKLVQTLTELNETIRNYTSSLIGKAIDFIGGTGLLALQIGMLSAQLGFLSSGQGILDYFSGFFGKSAKTGGSLATWEKFTKAKNAGAGGLPVMKGGPKGFFAPFIKGFTRAQAQGQGFFKSLNRGLGGLGNSLKSNIINSLDIFSKNTDRFFRKLSISFYKFSQKTLPRLIEGFTLIGDYIGGKFIKYLRIGKARLFDLGRSFVKINWLDLLSLPGRKIIESLSFIGDKGSMIFDSFKKGMSIRHMAIMAYIKAYRGLRSLPSIIKAAFSAKGIANGIRGVGKGLSFGIKGIMKGAKAAILGGTAGFAQIVFSVIDGLFGAFYGFKNTGENFKETLRAMGKSTEEASWGMYAASTTAGALTGILDGLTFGLLGFLGVTKPLEKILSQLGYLLFSVLEGVVEGAKWAFGLLSPLFKSVGEAFSSIGQSFLNIFNSIAGIFGAEASNLGEAFALIYPWLKAIGKVIGAIVVSPIVAVLGALGGALWLVAKAFQGVAWIVEKLVSAIVAPFKWLYNILVGNSIIPDLCTAIVGFFGKMAFNVMSIVGKMIWGVAKFFLKLPFKLLKGMFNFFVKFPLKMIGDTLKLAGKIFTMGIPSAIRGLSKFFASFKGYFFEFSKVAFNTWAKLLNYISGGWFNKISGVFSRLISLISKGAGWVADKTKNGVKWVADKVKGGASWAGDKVKGGAKWVVDSVKGGLKNVGQWFYKFLPKSKPVTSGGGGFWSVAPETVKNTAKNAMSNTTNFATKNAPKALSFLGKSSKLIGSLAKKLPYIGPLLDFGIRKTTGQSTGKAAVGAAGGFGGAVSGAAMGSMILPGIGTAVGGLIGALGGGAIADALYDGIGSWFSSEKSEKLVQDTSNKLKTANEVASTPVGQHAIPVLKPEEGVSGVQPVHLSSISESILRDKAGTQGSSTKLQSDELSRIEEVSNKQVDELQLIREGIMTMVEILKPKGTVGEQNQEAGSTKDPRRPMHAAIFGKMKYGKVGGNANRTLINNGEV